MRHDRLHFGRMTINGTQIDLGHAAFGEMLRRVTSQYLKHQAVNKRSRISIEFSEERITGEIDPAKLLEHDFKPTIAADEDEWFPGVTVAEYVACGLDPIARRWNDLCSDPVKRHNLSADEISAAKFEYESKYPRIAPHWPEWI